MARVQLIKTATGYLPHSAHDEAELESIHIGDVVSAEVKKSRSPQFHKLAFAMMHEAFENQDNFHDFEMFREWLQIAAGCVETIIGPDRTYYKVKSLRWDRMDDLEFKKTFNVMLTALVERMGMDWILTRYA